MASSGPGAMIEVDAADTLRLIMQFLREHGLDKSLRTLQEESNISLNMVDDLPGFTADLLAGRWDVVVPQVAALQLPPQLVMSLYEQIVRELAEHRDAAAARAMMKGALPLLMLKSEEPERYSRLDALVTRMSSGTASDAGPFADGTSKESRRFVLSGC
jgi:WD40 repeat-containing protein SMU1